MRVLNLTGQKCINYNIHEIELKGLMTSDLKPTIYSTCISCSITWTKTYDSRGHANKLRVLSEKPCRIRCHITKMHRP